VSSCCCCYVQHKAKQETKALRYKTAAEVNEQLVAELDARIAERQVEVTSLTEARDASQLELATVQADLEQLRVSFKSYLLEQCEEEEATN
jgi:hypothetical protein